MPITAVRLKGGVIVLAYDGTLKFDTKIDTNGFNNGASKIAGLAKGAVGTTAKIIAGVSTAVAGLGAAAVKMGSDFEAQMSKVEAISGATGDQMTELNAKAMEMGAKTKFSATEAGQAFEYMAMAGWKSEDMLNGIEGVMNLAAAAGEDLGTTSDIVTDALTAFGMKAEESAHFADILAAASSNSNTNVSLLGTSFKYVAPVAGAMAYKAEDVAVALGLMANSGIKSTMAGAALRNIITNMAKPTDQVAEAMSDLNLSLEDGEGGVKSLKDVMGDLREAFGNIQMPQEEFAAALADLDSQFESGAITEEKYNKATEELYHKAFGAEGALKAQYAATLAGRQGMAGLLAIVNSSEEDYNALTDAIYGCDGAAEQMAETMNDNLQGQIVILKSSLEGLALTLYQDVQTSAKDTVVAFKDMVNSMNDAYKENGFEGLAEAAGDAFAQIAVMAGEVVPKIVNVASTFVSSFAKSISEHVDELGASGAEIVTAIANAIITNVGTMYSAAAELLASLLSHLSENIPQLIETAKEAASTLAQALIDNGPTIGASAASIIAQLASALIDNMPAIIDTAGQIAKAFLDGVEQAIPGLSPIIELLKGLAEHLDILIPIIAAVFAGQQVFGFATTIVGLVGKIMALKDAAGGVLGVFQMLFPVLAANPIALVIAAVAGLVAGLVVLYNTNEDFRNLVNEVWTAVTEFVAGAVQAIIEFFTVTLPEAFTNVVTWFTELPAKITEFFSALVEMAAQFFSDAIESIAEFLSNAADAIGQFLTDLPYNVGYAIGLVLGSIIQFGIDAISWVAETIPQIIDGIVTFFMELPDKVWEWLVNTYNNIVQWGKDAFDSATKAAQDLVAKVSEFISELPGKVKEWLDSTIENVAQFASDLAEKATSAAQDFWDNFVSVVEGLPDKMMEIGENIVRGVWDGIQNMADWLWNTVTDFFSGLVNGVCDALGIGSPSKVFAERVGEWIPPGVGEGIEDSMPDLLKNADDQMASLADRMQGAVDAESSRISFDKTGAQEYEQARSERTSQQNVTVSGTLEGNRPMEIHTNLYLDKKKFAREVTPAVNYEMYRIDQSENGRGRGN